MVLRFLVLLASVFCFLSPAQAETPRHTEARLFSAVKGVGQLASIPVGVEIKMEPGWKTYWRTPGEAGLAPVFNWAESANVKAAAVSWPAPHRFIAFDIDNFGYKDAVSFPIGIAPKTAGEPVTLKLKLDLLVCKTLCVPETHLLALTVPAGDSKVSADQGLLEAALRKIPVGGDEESFSLRNVWLEEGDDGKPYLRVNAQSASPFGKEADMFVEHASFTRIGKPDFTYDKNARTLQARAPVRSEGTLESLQQTLRKSPLTLTFSDGSRAFERRAALGGVPPAHPVREILREAHKRIDPALLFMAFLGGLILNLMPCVLPVLSLKILSVLGHGGKDHRIHRWPLFRSFMAAAAGIVFSFWMMAGGLIALKAAGRTIGWGIQFQHPGFLIFLIAVLSVFAANMWGLFEIPLPRVVARHLSAQHEHEPTLLGHFLTGAFATLLATPCTAPFLGTAVGFALAGTPVDILVIFTFLGLGLAFPYMALAVSPRIFRHMPTPGAWMVTLRKILAAALALTAVWLINVLITVSTQATLDEGWTQFDEALIKPAVEEGQTVIVDVTADWCLTCKANKRLVLEQKDIMDALSVPNVLRLQADWTHRDENIAAYMRKYGRYGIPFNIVYGPGVPEGIILSEILTKKSVMRALEEAAGE